MRAHLTGAADAEALADASWERAIASWEDPSLVLGSGSVTVSDEIDRQRILCADERCTCFMCDKLSARRIAYRVTVLSLSACD